MKRHSWWQSMFFLALWAASASVAVAVQVRDNPEAEFLFKSMLQNRLLLNSGQYRIENGRYTYQRETELAPWQTDPFSIFCAFDETRLRFDRTTTERFAPDGHVEVETAKWFRTPERSVSWHVGASYINYSVPSKPRPISGPFDVRGLGLTNQSNLIGKWTPMEAVVEFFLNSESHVSIATDNDGKKMIQIGSESSDDTISQIWFDVDRGYSVTRAILKTKQANQWKSVNWQETQWDAKNSVWVPVSKRLEFTVPADSNPEIDLHYIFQFDVTWDSINEPVDDTLFSHESFGATEPYGILDDSTGKRVVVKPLSDSEVEPIQPPKVSNGRHFLLVGNVILFVAVAIFWWMRRE